GRADGAAVGAVRPVRAVRRLGGDQLSGSRPAGGEQAGGGCVRRRRPGPHRRVDGAVRRRRLVQPTALQYRAAATTQRGGSHPGADGCPAGRGAGPDLRPGWLIRLIWIVRVVWLIRSLASCSGSAHVLVPP